MNAADGDAPYAFGEYADEWPIVYDLSAARPLYIAVLSGWLELVEGLLDAGADIDALSFGWTALHAAAAKPCPEMIDFLLQRGAAIDAKSKDGRTAIDLLQGFRRSANLLRIAVQNY